MSRVSRRAVALAQLMEVLARLVLAASRCDVDQIEQITYCLTRLSYDYEQAGTYYSKDI
jgi:hypothetical protein